MNTMSDSGEEAEFDDNNTPSSRNGYADHDDGKAEDDVAGEDSGGRKRRASRGTVNYKEEVDDTAKVEILSL